LFEGVGDGEGREGELFELSDAECFLEGSDEHKAKGEGVSFGDFAVEDKGVEDVFFFFLFACFSDAAKDLQAFGVSERDA
jgi:hypothetical protein